MSVLVRNSERCRRLGWYGNVFLFFSVIPPSLLLCYTIICKVNASCRRGVCNWILRFLKVCVTCFCFLGIFLMVYCNETDEINSSKFTQTSWDWARKGLTLLCTVAFKRQVSKSHWEQKTELDWQTECVFTWFSPPKVWWCVVCFFFFPFYLLALLMG